ncbi:hypothetical protein AB0M36_37205 [Actinoplanes sp. NPDC051346]|uniref:hypothetical protein n=1 Tax=Actinoplanes sp. NPDC051346 TaxID=3155048 RepID=UPI00341E33C5
MADIHTAVEIYRDGRWRRVRHTFPSSSGGRTNEVFEHPDYGIFGFLADVRNYSHSPVIAAPRGLPAGCDVIGDDFDWWRPDLVSVSWLTLAELQAYDYEQVFWDRRIHKDGDGAALAREGEGEHRRLRDFLSPYFFERLAMLAELGAPEDLRLIIGFDE